ncbi:permease-like cell division protein FtsX [uncultured Agathobaculum sp.]|uniref:permease-like cell division protein FtsX n=1 Tax=uncultured Agathobaculum sp. TaxID=2048140 RepID=UPI00296EFFC4
MRSIGYYWKEGLRNIFKHGFMSVAAIVIMVACLLLTGTVTLVSYNIDNNITALQQSNQIVVWIDDSLTTREAKALQSEFEKIDNIATIEFEDRDVALEQYRKELGDDASILEDYNEDNNPLRNSYVFTLTDSTQAEQTISRIESVDGVASVRADENVIQKLIQIQNVFNIVALAMIVGLAVISIFIISNTVKLAMFARRAEISIQKMVGATNWFIRWPFVIEGMVLGLVAGGLAFLAEWGLYTELYSIAGTVSLSSFHLLSFEQLRWWVLGVYCGAGALFGIGGSVTSIRKFMDV